MFNMERDVWKFAVALVLIGFIGVWLYDGYAEALVENYYAESRGPVPPAAVMEQIKRL